MSTITTACALDCYDACKIIVNDEEFPKIFADSNHPTGSNALCTLLHKSIHEESRIEEPTINGVAVSMEEAMEAVFDAFKKDSSLLWRGSGNMGVMQDISNLFMEQIGGHLTKGSLCDGSGDAGINSGRGINRGLEIEQISKADTVVVWGRNLTVTNAHIMPFLEGKNIVVIDPIKTAIAKKADLHLQIKPRTDFYIAIMLARFIHMEDEQNSEWLEEFAPEFEEFYEFTREFRVKPILDYCETNLGEMGKVLNYIRNKKVVFLVGTGVQKYTTGHSVLHAIDSLAATLGLFGTEGCGVHYPSNSRLGFKNPFEVSCRKVSKVVTNFSQFNTVLIQGGNPAESMPDSNRVCKELDSVKNLIYFGLYENETSKRAKIVIPAKNFFEKEDIRLSYGHQYVEKMNRITRSNIGISEYNFTKILFEKFNFNGLESQEYYIDFWLKQCKNKNEQFISPAYKEMAYKEGFGEDKDDNFEFIEEYDDDFVNTKQFTKVRTSKKNMDLDKKFWLLTPKANKSLNTQFYSNTKVKLHPTTGYMQNETVELCSDFGSLTLEVELSEDIYEDCVVVTNNTKGVNMLTPPLISDEGESACYQEVKVTIKQVS